MVNKYMIILLSCLLGVLCLVVGCEREVEDNTSINDVYNRYLMTYSDENFGFKVDYPSEWNTEVEPMWEATAEHEGSPDGGINIYIEDNKDESMYVFGQHGHIVIPPSGLNKEAFITNSGIEGCLYSSILDERIKIYLILDSGFHGAYINVSKMVYNQYEQDIMNILKSIDLTS